MALDPKYMSEETQKLVDKWFGLKVNPADAAMILLVAELTGQQPDTVRLRLHNLKNQCAAVVYDTEYDPEDKDE
jgi:hypothetical protein